MSPSVILYTDLLVDISVHFHILYLFQQYCHFLNDRPNLLIFSVSHHMYYIQIIYKHSGRNSIEWSLSKIWFLSDNRLIQIKCFLQKGHCSFSSDIQHTLHSNILHVYFLHIHIGHTQKFSEELIPKFCICICIIC